MAEDYIIGGNAQFNENVDVLGKLNLFDDLVVDGDLRVTGTMVGNGSLPSVSVGDYGAVGNGINDDTDSIQNALDKSSGAWSMKNCNTLSKK